MTERIAAGERVWAHVDTDGGLFGCWPWLGQVNENGYGVLGAGGRGGRRVKAHRVAYESRRGPIPDGLTIDHLCRNRLCVNPAHLEAVAQGVNTLRGTSPWALHARQTHCVNGHPFDAANTYRRRNRTRACRACAAERARRRAA